MEGGVGVLHRDWLAMHGFYYAVGPRSVTVVCQSPEAHSRRLFLVQMFGIAGDFPLITNIPSMKNIPTTLKRLAEAVAIVDEIEDILADPYFDGRTIGVVTLLGTAQAVCIQKLISDRISLIDQLARKIAVGPPPVFQGRGRDIMMVSMVLGPSDMATQNRADQHQRFNVALSRARGHGFDAQRCAGQRHGVDSVVAADRCAEAHAGRSAMDRSGSKLSCMPRDLPGQTSVMGEAPSFPL